MSEKQIDLAALRGIAQDLSGVVWSMNSCDASEAGLAGAVGHEGLSVDIERFQAAWAAEREAVTEELGTLAVALQETADRFQEIDEAAAEAITQAVLNA